MMVDSELDIGKGGVPLYYNIDYHLLKQRTQPLFSKQMTQLPSPVLLCQNGSISDALHVFPFSQSVVPGAVLVAIASPNLNDSKTMQCQTAHGTKTCNDEKMSSHFAEEKRERSQLIGNRWTSNQPGRHDQETDHERKKDSRQNMN